MGGGMGAGAGLAMAAGGNEEAQAKQSELALKWQEFGIEKQKMQLAMRDDAEWQNYTEELPADERAIARKDPQGYSTNYIAARQWGHTISTLKGDPQFAASIGIKDPKIIDDIAALDPKHGEQVFTKYLEASQSGKYPGGVHGPYEDGKGGYYMMGLGMSGETTQIPVGKPAQMILGEQRVGIAQQQADTAAQAKQQAAADSLDKYQKLHPLPFGVSMINRDMREWKTGARAWLKGQGATASDIDATLSAIPDNAPKGSKTKTEESASSSGASEVSPPKGYVVSKTRGPKGEALYENPLAPASKRYWSAD